MENKDLQEELKLREDSLFDQDDELEKRNADLAKAKRALELMQIEVILSSMYTVWSQLLKGNYFLIFSLYHFILVERSS